MDITANDILTSSTDFTMLGDDEVAAQIRDWRELGDPSDTQDKVTLLPVP